MTGTPTSRPVRTLIEHLAFVLTVDAEDRVLADAAVLVANDKIEAVGTTDELVARYRDTPLDRRVDGRRLGMTPGFVDAHVHLSEMLSRAAFPDLLSTRAWVFHWAKPFYAHVTDDDEDVSIRLGTVEMLRSGTTCFLDMGAQNDPGVSARAVEEVGIRGVVARHAADRQPEEVPPGWSKTMLEHHFFPDAETALNVLKDAVRTWHGYADGRVRCWVNIEGKEPCSLELHVGARQLAATLGVGTTYHIASSIEEAHVSERRYGQWPVTRIAQAGGLGDNLVLAHAVALQDAEIQALAQSGTKVAFCPSTSLKLAKGATSIGKYPELLEAGAIVALGTDGVSAAGNVNLHRQIHLAAGLFKDARLEPTLVGARKALRMGTIEGAEALGWDDEIGSIEPGKKADFVLFDLDHHEWTPYADPLQALVWSVSPASIHQTWVDGRPRFVEGAVGSVDEVALRTEARQRAGAILDRAGLSERAAPLTTTLYD